ncbi:MULTISPECIES: YlbG family protein [Lactobacillaceae]|uniref:YlbG family protein n=1 Tax=Lactobacillaceae TaxID=33958 RepID=UPI0014573FFD|nr:YlbG family protein [Lactobacillus sp. HBUAS51381]NLR09284.1 YlbG family protein [Lactobacillus sp. HBUAS51381]
MAFEIQARQSLVVYTYSLKQTRQLKRYGTVMYVSKKMRYVVLYVNREDVPALTEQLNHLRFVKRVVASQRPAINETFNGVAEEMAAAKDDEK